MADGTIAMLEGLGGKVIDSNEMRRRQRNSSEPTKSQQIRSVQVDLETPNLISSGDPSLRSTLRGPVPPPSSAEFGEISPNSVKSSSPSRKLQQVFEQELIRQSEEIASGVQNNTGQEKKIRDPTGPLNLCGSELGSTVTGLVPLSSPNGIGAQSPNSYKNSSPAQKSKQVHFKDGLVKEAEARARASQVQGNSHQLQCSSSEVQKSKSKPKVLFNSRGNPYVEGDPNLGFPVEDTKPRYFPSTQVQDTKSGLVSKVAP